MKVWITKYALTQGIFAVEASHHVDAGMVKVKGDFDKGTFDQYFHGEGRDWHRTEVEAIERAILMASKRTNSLKKSLSQNENLTHRFIQELRAVRLGEPKPPKPAKKLTKAQLATLKKESEDQQLADEQAESDRMSD